MTGEGQSCRVRKKKTLDFFQSARNILKTSQITRKPKKAVDYDSTLRFVYPYSIAVVVA
jgi:hypothetical protein